MKRKSLDMIATGARPAKRRMKDIVGGQHGVSEHSPRAMVALGAGVAKRRSRAKKIADRSAGTTPEVEKQHVAPQSVWELMGIREVRYKFTDFREYMDHVRELDDMALNLECTKCGVSPSWSRDYILDRLEEKWLKFHPDQKEPLR